MMPVLPFIIKTGYFGFDRFGLLKNFQLQKLLNYVNFGSAKNYAHN